MENHSLLGPKSGRGRLQVVVVYQRFQLSGFDRENFGVLDWWSLVLGGCLQEVVAPGGSGGSTVIES